MKILHILNDKPTELSTRIIEEQKKEHEVKVIELAKRDIPYETIIDYIFSYDRVISW